MSEEPAQSIENPIEEQIEEVIDGFMTVYARRGHTRPYGIYLTTKRIIGIKTDGLKRRLGTSLLYLVILLVILGVAGLFGLGTIIFPVFIVGYFVLRFILRRFYYKKFEDTKKTIEELEEKKDFEVFTNELREIRLQKSKKHFGGPLKDLIIQSYNFEYIISIYKGGPFTKIEKMFNMNEQTQEIDPTKFPEVHESSF
jgi:hypothetical protein